METPQAAWLAMVMDRLAAVEKTVDAVVERVTPAPAPRLEAGWRGNGDWAHTLFSAYVYVDRATSLSAFAERTLRPHFDDFCVSLTRGSWFRKNATPKRQMACIAGIITDDRDVYAISRVLTSALDLVPVDPRLSDLFEGAPGDNDYMVHHGRHIVTTRYHWPWSALIMTAPESVRWLEGQETHGPEELEWDDQSTGGPSPRMQLRIAAVVDEFYPRDPASVEKYWELLAPED
jgi:hypothetical protein